VPFQEARRLILDQAALLEPESVPLVETLGRVLAESVVAPRPHPQRDDSAMDGYAVRRADLVGASREAPVRLPLAPVPSVPGLPEAPPLPQGHALQILTGAPVPAEADAVVRQEATAREGETVLFWSEPEPGANIRRAGEDFPQGAELLSAGALLGPGEIAALAAMGISRPRVVRRPVVAILTTGDEVRPQGDTLRPGQIYDANGPALSAMVSEAGGLPLLLGPVRDEKAALRERLTAAADADALVTVAGISVGERDLVAETLSDLGVRFVVRGVRMKPGHPTSFGLWSRRPVFALPGNPAACLIAFETLVRPALRKMAGHTLWDRPQAIASIESPFHGRGGSTQFVRGLVHPDRAWRRLCFRPLARQGVGMLTSMIGHNALAVLPPERKALAPGESVEVLLVGNLSPLPLSKIPVVTFLGRSGSGKTTLITRLLPALRARGLRVAALKNSSHGFQMDREGKDTWRFSQAGAVAVAVVGRGQVGALLEGAEEEIHALAARLFPGVDLVLAEGFHGARCPAVLVLDERDPQPRDLEVLDRAIAVVGDSVKGVACLPRDDIEGLVTRIVRAVAP
jgi:molybdopterin molybdotransferase